MCLGQHFLSNSGIKIPGPEHVTGPLEPASALGCQCFPAARPVRWAAIAGPLSGIGFPSRLALCPEQGVACLQLFAGREQAETRRTHCLCPDLRLQGAALRRELSREGGT